MTSLGIGKENNQLEANLPSRNCSNSLSQSTLATNLTPQTITTNQINILEWRYNQFLGEKLTSSDLNDEENQSYVISDMKMTDNGEYLIVGDMGGRLILFQRRESRKSKNLPRLNYFFEYSAYDRDFDVHKSTEYSEVVRAITPLPSQHTDKIDILSCGYRTIKLHRVYNSKIRLYSSNEDTTEDSKNNNSTCSNGIYFKNASEEAKEEPANNYLTIPKLRSIRKDLNCKLKKSIKIENSTELNSLSCNNIFKNQFISSDDSKILLWDMNYNKSVYDIIDLENDNPPYLCEDHPEKITKSLISQKNPHLISFGTNYGNIKLCDTRSGSEVLETSSKYLDEFQNITNSSLNLTKTIFSTQIMSVHDINFNLYNENLFASRHSLSVNLWDQRNPQQPVNKFLVYEPIISKLSQMYTKNYLADDKFSLSTDSSGKFLLTGGYNNMFHIFDLDQKLNQQITIDCANEKIMNTNIIRKINSKGSCFYKKDDSTLNNINFDCKITKHCFSAKENFINMSLQNCIYSYSGNYIKKDTAVKK